MLVLGRDEMAKYPFMPDVGKYMQEYGFELSQLSTDPIMQGMIGMAFERVMASTRGEIYKSDGIADAQILSFVIAIILIKLSGRPTLVRRFALSEARRAEAYLVGDLSDRRDHSRADVARHMMDKLFGLKVEMRNYRYLIPVPDYLMHSSAFHEREWKLVNRQVEDGYVILKPDKAVRLIRHALTVYITTKIRDSSMPDMIPGLENMVAELVTIADKLTPTYEQTTAEHPPCVKHAIKVLQNGENLPHSGRFMLGTFLLAMNQSVEEIAPLFKNAPDYNERVTRYQLNNLAGGASGERYMCPGCDKLRTQNLCFAEAGCEGIVSPLQFGRRRKS